MKLIRLLKNDLSAEAAEWVKEKIISKEQAENILSRYGAKLPHPQQKSFAYYVLPKLSDFFQK